MVKRYRSPGLPCIDLKTLDREKLNKILSEPKFNLSTEQMQEYVRWYIAKRSEHDSEFRCNRNKHREMERDFDDVRMKELSVYASCTRKRPLHIKPYMNRRKQLLHLTAEHLKTSTFDYA